MHKNSNADSIMKSELDLADLAAQFAHDIRSPLSALNVLAAIYENHMSEDAKALMRAILHRLNDLACDLLAFQSSELLSCQKTQSFCLPTMLSSLASEKRTLCTQPRSVKWTVDLGPLAHGDWFFQNREIPRMISNLLDNAREAISPQGGQVWLGAVRSCEKLMILIQDDGCGIAPEVLPELGKRGLSLGKKSGHGLGLYYAKRLMKSLGGSLQLESRLHKGTSVILEFPIDTRGTQQFIGVHS